MDKRIVVNWQRYLEDEKLFLLIEAFLRYGWQLVFVDRGKS